MILFHLMKNSDKPLRLLLIEDDELTLEVLTLQMTAQGYQVESAESGEAALLQLEQMQHGLPDAVLTDLQLPGTSGQDLLHRLRTVSDGGMTLLAMSASQPEDAILSGFHGFLLKPFTMVQLAEALQSTATQPSNSAPIAPSADPSAATPSLDEAVYLRLAGSMPDTQLQQLYTLCIDDASTRLGRMRLAGTNGDDATYRKEAHAIKGGCSMVGATELYRLASAVEESGLSAANHVASLDEMLSACGRLHRILVAREARAKF
jgi:CheY-like chemotaxis protein/HPt (histidine-containing phosphotransfer) domain-containing protein